jgi:hypothetical protein
MMNQGKQDNFLASMLLRHHNKKLYRQFRQPRRLLPTYGFQGERQSMFLPHGLAVAQ